MTDGSTPKEHKTNQWIPVRERERLFVTYNKPKASLNWGMDLPEDELPKASVATPLLVMLHDFPGQDITSHNGLLEALANDLELKGLPSLLINFRGCGKSEGNVHNTSIKSMEEDIRTAIDHANIDGEYFSLIFVACGMSALPVLEYIKSSKGLLEVKACAFFWPTIHPVQSEIFRALAKKEPDLLTKGPQHKHYKYGNHLISEGLLNDMRAFDTLTHLKNINFPLMIQQGSLDRSAPIGQLDTVRSHTEPPYLDIQVFEGAGNGLTEDNIRPHVINISKQFIEKFSMS